MRISTPGRGRAIVRAVNSLKGATQRAMNSASAPQEYFRPHGKPHGSHVAGSLSSRKMAILLCRSCRHKFDHKRHNYYKDRRFSFAGGRCDACREYEPQGSLFIHESLLTGPNGYPTMHGHSWVPK